MDRRGSLSPGQDEISSSMGYLYIALKAIVLCNMAKDLSMLTALPLTSPWTTEIIRIGTCELSIIDPKKS